MNNFVRQSDSNLHSFIVTQPLMLIFLFHLVLSTVFQ